MNVPFDSLQDADLIVDAVYEGGDRRNVGDDPISRLVRVGNMGGIRRAGPASRPSVVVLVTSGSDLDWPDSFNEETGLVTYFGDNKRPGRALHDTASRGNEVLRNIFELAANPAERGKVPPVLVFAATGERRHHRFIGLAVPGAVGVSSSEDLVGIWRSTNGLRYQNYRALFTVLDAGTISRTWLNALVIGDRETGAPEAWLDWLAGGNPRALVAPRTTETRSRREQEGSSDIERATVEAIWSHFADRPHAFEGFAAHLVQLYLTSVSAIEVTRPSRDGGRDAIGRYRVGEGASGIEIDFAMEAKCYRPGNGVGVRELSRLISRLRHRQFGVLVTTSHLDRQAYTEVKEDRHPIVVLAGRDIARILHRAGMAAADGGIQNYLDSMAPRADSAAEYDRGD